MSWIEQTNKGFIITCGDGVKFQPEWMNATKSIEYNVKEFNFPNVSGTLVDRREPKGAKYSLELFFQGEDHLDTRTAFEVSAADKRFWTITHPLYGLIDVQPVSLVFDNTKHNVTKITAEVIETITDTNPKAVIIPEDKIEEDNEFANEAAAESFAANVTPSPTDIATAKQDNNVAYARTSPDIENDIDGQEYFNAFNEANAAMTNAASDAGGAIRKTQSFIEAPARFQQSVKSRLSMLGDNFQSLRKNIQGTATTVPKSTKQFYEVQAGATIGAMALASSIIFDDDDYKNRPQVVEVVEILLRAFSQYLGDLDSMQLGTGGNPNDYIPTAQSIIDTNDLLNYTMGNLFQIGLTARQERFYTTTDETDLISLAHQLYGLSNGDESINELIRNNGLGLNHILKVAKDITLKYYI